MQKTSRFSFWLPFLLSCALAGGIFIGMQLSDPAPKTNFYAEDKDSGHHKIEELLRYIDAKYVDDVDRSKLVDEAISSILRQLDPHSSYIAPAELEKLSEQMEGEFMGIGVEFMLLEDTVIVVSVTSGSPAQKAGILAGDKIITIQDSLVSGKKLSSEEVVKRLRDEKNLSVKVGILRYPDQSIKALTLTRKKIPIKSIDAAYWLNNKVAYIRINRFSATTDKEFLAALERLSERNKKIHLILDLRHNPGGYLQQASNILSQIFPERGELLVYTEGRSVNRADYHSTGRAFFDIGNIAVLIDEGSASASEIIAGAIQDHDRGFVIGRRSFGKGLVQEQYRLNDGSAIRLTVARYFTPSGRSIQKPYDQDEIRSDKALAYATPTKDKPYNSGQTDDSTTFYTNAGRVVYSGGGITPDIQVPEDSLDRKPLMQEIQSRLPVFSLKAYLKVKSQYAGDRAAFFSNYMVEEKVLEELEQFLNSSGLSFTKQEWQLVKGKMPQLLKAHIARNLFGLEAYFQVVNREDRDVQTAMEHLFAAVKPRN